MKPAAVATALGPAALAVALGLARWATVPLWRDEFATAMHASLTLPELIAALRTGDAVMAAYYVLIHLLSPLTGFEEGMRAVSLFAVAVATGIVAVMARRWWGTWAGLAAGISFALNGAVVTTASTARPYALMLLFFSAATLSAVRALDGRRGAWAAYAVFAALSVSMHVLSALPLAAIGVLALPHGRSVLVRWGAWTMPAVVTAGALALAGSLQQGQLSWLLPPSPQVAVAELAQAAGVSPYRGVSLDVVALAVLAFTAVALLIAARASAPASGRRQRRASIVFAAALCFGGPAALFVWSWIGSPAYTVRYLAWSGIGAALLIGAGVAALAARRGVAVAAGAAAAVLLVGGGIAIWVGFQRPAHLYDDFPALVSAVAAHALPGDGLVVIDGNPHYGIAYGVASTIGDASWQRGIRSDLVAGGDGLSFRAITGTAPVSTAAQTGTSPHALWVVALAVPTESDVRRIEDVSGCTVSLRTAAVADASGLMLFAARCESVR